MNRPRRRGTRAVTQPVLSRVVEASSVVAAAPQHDLRGVLRVRPFRKLWLALSLSSLGDWLGLLATTALAQDLSKSYSGKSFAIGGVLVVRLLPALFLGPIAGVFADRFDRRHTMVVCDVIRASLFVSIPIVHNLPWLLVASFAIESVSLFWIPAKEASVPNLLPPERLEAANQLSLITTYGAAPIAAGIFALLSVLNRVLASAIPFFSTNPVDLALYFNGATFMFSAATVFGLHEIPRVSRSRDQEEGAEALPQPSFLHSITEGWAFVGQTPLVRGLVVGMLGAFAAGGCVIALGRLFVALLGGGDAAYGLLFGAVFLGLAGGMALGPRLLHDFSRHRLFGLAIMGAGASLTVLSVLPNIILALFFVMFVGIFAGIAWVIGYTLLGLEVADEMRGRTFAFVQSLVRVDLLVVLAAAPVIVGAIGAHRIRLANGAYIRADGVTITWFVAGLLASGVGLLAFRQMDDRRGVSVLSDLTRALRRKAREVLAPRTTPGFFVAFEGGEGAGKSTQVAALADALRDLGHEVVITREPGATVAGAQIRALLLDPAHRGLSSRAEALLYAADRAEHVSTVIRPALERGAIVITDRYVDSSLAYQGAGRSLDLTEVARLSNWATDGLRPDVTILLDLPAEVGLRRAGARSDPDRLEGEEREFHDRVREGFLDLATREPSRYTVIAATLPTEEVSRRVRDAVLDRLPIRPVPTEVFPVPEPVPSVTE